MSCIGGWLGYVIKTCYYTIKINVVVCVHQKKPTLLVQNGFTALHFASHHGHHQVVQVLITAGASLNLLACVSVVYNK